MRCLTATTEAGSSSTLSVGMPSGVEMQAEYVCARAAEFTLYRSYTSFHKSLLSTAYIKN